jgi:hypothetical protein
MISAAVNTLNSVNHNLDNESRKRFAHRLATAMEPKIADGDATDCSRLAWLLIRCEREDRAIEIVECGLRLDPDAYSGDVNGDSDDVNKVGAKRRWHLE